MATVDFWASVYRDVVSAVDIRGSTNRGEKHISPFILEVTKPVPQTYLPNIYEGSTEAFWG